MDRRRGRLARWLGAPATRRRRHRRAGALGGVLLAVAGLLILLGGGDDDEDAVDAAGELCAEFGDRIQEEYALSFPDGAPLTEAAAAEYLSRPFADTMEELVASLRALELPDELATAVDALAERIEAVRTTPEEFVLANPLDGIAERFDDAEAPACGSEFFAPPE